MPGALTYALDCSMGNVVEQVKHMGCTPYRELPEDFAKHTQTPCADALHHTVASEHQTAHPPCAADAKSGDSPNRV